MAKVGVFDVVYRYWIDPKYWQYSSGEPNLDKIIGIRQWCADNLQFGYEVLHLRITDKLVIVVSDETDYDFLIMKWGK